MNDFSNILKEVKNNKCFYDMYATDHNFVYSVNLLASNPTNKQILALLFMLCDGHKNKDEELRKYLIKYGSLYEEE